MLPADPSHQPQSTPIVGRTREHAVLRECLAATLAGQGRVVLIGGEAGIGKTTLVDRLADEARLKGALILAGHCYDLTRTSPYGPWLDAFAGASPAGDQANVAHPLQMGTDLGAITNQSLLFEQVRAFLRNVATSHPAMLVLEDLHWSDPASLELLRYLARGIGSFGLLLIATYRVDELTRQHPLFRLLPLLVREAHAARIDLQALTDHEVQALVRSRYSLAPDDETRLATYLQSRAEGNPFFLTEVLRTLEAKRLLQPAGDRWRVGELDRVPVPPLARQVIEGRLATLDDKTRELLEIAAVIGQEVPLDVWQRASEADDDQLILAMERANDAHLIFEMADPTGIRFTHALVRETLYHGQVLLRRRMRHRRVAEILVDRPDAPSSTVAAHFEQADDPRAIDWLIRAGERALALYAAHDAIAALTRAHELAARFSQDLPLEAYRARASAQIMLGQFDQARRDHEFVLQRARAIGNRRAEWQALVDLGMLWAERDYERTGTYYRAALDLARSIDDKPMIAYSLNRIANWHVNLDEPDTALPLHEEALTIFEECGDRNGIADTLDLLGIASYLNCDLAASTQYYERAIALLRDADDRQRLSSSLVTIALNGGTLDCNVAVPVYREAGFWLGSCEEGLAVAREIGWMAGEAYALIMLSQAVGVRGNLGRARRDVEAGRAIAERIGHRQWTVAARYVVGGIWKELLDLRRAAAELESALAAARISGSHFWTKTVAATLASVHIARGDLGHAAAILGTVVQANRPGTSTAQRQCWFAQAELALARGEPDRALAIIEELTRTTPGLPAEHSIPYLMKLRGDTLAQMR